MAFVAVIGKTHIRLPKSSTQKDAENFPSLVDSFYRILSKASEKELLDRFPQFPSRNDGEQTLYVCATKI